MFRWCPLGGGGGVFEDHASIRGSRLSSARSWRFAPQNKSETFWTPWTDLRTAPRTFYILIWKEARLVSLFCLDFSCIMGAEFDPAVPFWCFGPRQPGSVIQTDKTEPSKILGPTGFCRDFGDVFYCVRESSAHITTFSIMDRHVTRLESPLYDPFALLRWHWRLSWVMALVLIH